MPEDEERCPMSDLRPSECAHCLDGTKTLGSKAGDKPTLNEVIVADYAGVCPECHQSITVGDHIGWYMDGTRKRWAHYGCGV